jgi:hypothetical protein
MMRLFTMFASTGFLLSRQPTYSKMTVLIEAPCMSLTDKIRISFVAPSIELSIPA